MVLMVSGNLCVHALMLASLCVDVVCCVDRCDALQAEVSEWEEEAHRRLAEADEKQRAADRCSRDGANARRELERLKKAVEGSFEDLQRQVSGVLLLCSIYSIVVGLQHCCRIHDASTCT